MSIATAQQTATPESRRHARCPGCGRAFRLDGDEVRELVEAPACPGCGTELALAPARPRSYLILDLPPEDPAPVAATPATHADGQAGDPSGAASSTLDEAAPTDPAEETPGLTHEPVEAPADDEAIPLAVDESESAPATLADTPRPSPPPSFASEAETPEAPRRGRLLRFLLPAAAGIAGGAGVLIGTNPSILQDPEMALDGPPWLLPAAAGAVLVGLALGALWARRR